MNQKKHFAQLNCSCKKNNRLQKSVAGIFFYFILMLLTSSVFAQNDNMQQIPSTIDQLREQYTPSDYEIFLKKEKNGEIPPQDGVIYSPAAADALANNNAGSSTTANFTQSETTILAFGNNVIIGFNDSGSNFGGANKFTGWSYSMDGGATFTDGGTLPTNAGGDAGDPVMARNESTGRIYFSTLGFSVSTIQVFRSDDNGVTWMVPVNGTPGGSSEDKQWMAVDNFAGAGNGNVYLMSRRFGTNPGIYMFRSVDHGSTFGPNLGVNIVSGAQGAFVTVGPDHSVYAFWYAGTTLQMRKSTDQAITFGPAVTVVSGLVGGTNGDLGLTGLRQGTASYSSFRSNEFPHVAVNPVSGHIYVTFNDNPAGIDKADVYMVMSTDGGATWSARVRVNDDATTTDQWQPTIAVTPDGNSIGIFYYSRQEDPVDNNLFKYYGRTGVISGSTVTFTPSSAISDVASLPEFGRDAAINSIYMGDYNHAAATATHFHVVWSDNREDLAGGAPRKDPNVYYESIPAGILTGANISVIPSNVNFGPVSVTQTANSNITITNIGDAPLTVSSITSPSPDFSLTTPPLPAIIPSLGSIILTGSFSPTSLGIQNSSFNITSNALNNPVVTVNLTGVGVSNISVTPQSIDFGTVPVGQTNGPVPVTIQNPGTTNLTISAINDPTGDFSVTHQALPVVLPPLGSITVDAFFSPTSPGAHTSSFNILSDAIGLPSYTVNLQGNGIVAPPNDLCINAIPIDCGSSIDGTTVLATFDDVGTCVTSNTAPGVWYTITGNGAPITVSTCLAASYDTKLSVFEGSCGFLVCVGGNDDFSGCSLRSQVTFNSVSGTTYYVLVHGFLSATGTFTLSTSTCPAEISVAPDELTIPVALNGNGSGELTISNSADPGALDLNWFILGIEEPFNSGQGSQSFESGNAMFQITQETIAALQHLTPTVIRRQLETLMSEPPNEKEEFVNMVSNTIGEENFRTFYQVIMENSILFNYEIKEEMMNMISSTPQNFESESVNQSELDGAGGFDAFGYSWIDSDEPGGPVFNWVDITGTGTAVTLSDDASILVPLPFSFFFYGNNQNQVRISSNGYLTFGTSGATFTNTNIPNTATPNDIICPFWDDLNPAASPGGTIHYLSTATQFIVQYTNIRRFGTTQPNTFQVILNSDGSMLFQYLDMQGLLTSATVGIENATGTVGSQVVFNAAYIHNNLVVRLSLPEPCSWISSISPMSGTTPAGSSSQVTVNVNATGLVIGSYQCQLLVLSNAANGNQLFVPITLIVGTPVERINDLIAKVQALKAAGVLNKGQANALIVKLQAAKKNIDNGNINTAINELGAFINQVNDFVSDGILTTAQGEELVDAANAIIELLQNSLFKAGTTELANNNEIPDVYGLEQNYPNPFNPSTNIRFSIPESQFVTLRIYNILGEEVATLVNEDLSPGIYEVNFDAGHLASGMYIYNIKAGNFNQTKKLLLTK